MTSQPRPTRMDDIEALRVQVDLPDLRYVDFAAEYELREAYQRWPVLREIHVKDAGDKA